MPPLLVLQGGLGGSMPPSLVLQGGLGGSMPPSLVLQGGLGGSMPPTWPYYVATRLIYWRHAKGGDGAPHERGTAKEELVHDLGLLDHGMYAAPVLVNSRVRGARAGWNDVHEPVAGRERISKKRR